MIHPTACVHPSAELGAHVNIGEFAVIEAGTRIGASCRIGAHAIVRSGCELDAEVTVDSFAVIGGMPQMRGGTPAPGAVRIGARTVVREGVTVHRATRAESATTVGSDCYLMAHSHVGHDCTVGNFVTLANNVMLAGHVLVGDLTFVGGGAGIHQFVRIGQGVMIGGNASISYDVPPYSIAADRNDICGLNLVGIRRQGMPTPAVADLKRCFHTVFRGKGCPRTRAASALLGAACGSEAPGRSFLEFFAGGKRGFARSRAGKDDEAAAAE
jgi:UDP-N-acetylglucosamine acyltransferase